MAFNLKSRHFLTLRDFSPREIGFLLKLAADLKAAKYAGTEVPQLCGKEIALIFEKDSTRTRVGFEVAAFDQGAKVTIWGRLALILATRNRSRIPPGCWGASMMPSNTGASARPWLRS